MTAPAAPRISLEGVAARLGGELIIDELDLVVEAGETMALLGPSGCGKTTTLRLIAGLATPDDGTITIGDQVVAGPRWVPPERRGAGMVFQDWALFPHLSVGKNVAYGLPRRERTAETIDRLLSMVELEGFADRMPSTLSGGQQQRVALARALAPRTGVLLLDEPLSNLDATLRVSMRQELASLLRRLEVTTIFVTHDQAEAFALGDRVAVMRHGAIEQVGAPAELYRAPSSPWVASFVGDASFHEATASGGTATSALGAASVPQHLEGPVALVVRPEDVALSEHGTGGSEAVVTTVEYLGASTMVGARLDAGGTILIRCDQHSGVEPGDRVRVALTSKTLMAHQRP